LGILVIKDLVPGGQLEFIYDFSTDSPVITNLFPANRLSEINRVKDTDSYWQQLEEEPVYFETRLPQKFDTAEVELVYQNKNQPLIQVGLRTLGENDWNYYFKPLENQLLNKLNWFKLESEEGTIWQKEKKYLSWPQFLDNLDSLKNLAAYDYPLQRKFTIPDYHPTDKLTVIDRTIRGRHSFYTYIKNEPLDFIFTVQDINRAEGPDFLTVSVYNEANERIYQKQLADDGYISKLDPASDPRDVSLKINGLSEGVYRIELECEDEIFFRRITARQQYITFINRIYVTDNPEYADGFVDLDYSPVSLYNTIPRLGFETSHPEGLQTVGIGTTQSLSLSEIHKNYFITATELPVVIQSSKNDLKIFGRGLIAFSKAMYFNPEIYELRDFFISEGTDYLISQYKTPESLANGWKKNSVKFDLTNAEIVNRKLRFALSIPELNSSAETIPLKSIKITLDKKPLSYREIIGKIFKYIREKF
jgi:hypothetical protein